MDLGFQMRWMLRLAVVMLVVAAAEVLVVLLVPRPMPWAAIIPSLTPMLTTIFIVIPMLRARRLHSLQGGGLTPDPSGQTTGRARRRRAGP